MPPSRPLLYFLLALALVSLACGVVAPVSPPPAASLTPDAAPATMTADDTPPESTAVPTRAPAPTPTRPPAPTATVDPNLADWTVLVYLAGGAERGARADETFAALAAAGASDRVQLGVQLSGANSRRFAAPAPGGASALAGEGAPAAVTQTLGTRNPGDPAELADFLTWGIGVLPARHTALILWGHGAGWPGFGPVADPLRPAELAAGLAAGLATAGLSQLDVVAFDAGQMGQVEVFGAIWPNASLGVGTTAPDWGQSWDVEALLRGLVADPAMSPVQLARQIVLAAPPLGGRPAGDPVAVDLSGWPELRAAIEALADSLLVDPALVAGSVGAAKQDAATFSRLVLAGRDLDPTVDLWHFARVLEARSPDPAVSIAARAVATAVEAIVVAGGRAPAASPGPGLGLWFPSAAPDLSYGDEAGLPRWSAYLETHAAADASQAPDITITRVLSPTVSWQRPAYLEVAVIGRDVADVTVRIGRQEPDGSVRLLVFEPLVPAATLSDGSPARPAWGDGLNEAPFIWDTALPYLTDGQTGGHVVLWPLAPDSGLLLVEGRYRPEPDAPFQDAALIVDRPRGAVAGIWGFAAGATGAPVVIGPSETAEFQLTDLYLDDLGNIGRREGGTVRVSPELAVEERPAPDGDYLLWFRATSHLGRETGALQALAVNNGTLLPGRAAFLDPFRGFQFHYPADWSAPHVQGGRLVAEDPAGETRLTISPLEDLAAGTTAADLRAQTLDAFGPVDVLYESESALGGLPGRLTAYGYTDEQDEARTGLFATVVHGDLGLVIDVDGPAEAEAATLAFVDVILAEWVFLPIAFAPWQGDWIRAEAGPFRVTRPADYAYEALESGWHRFAAPIGPAFAAVRMSEGDEPRAALADWLRVAGAGVTGFVAEPPGRTALGGRVWWRQRFRYARGEGSAIEGALLVTADMGSVVVAWLEAPSDRFATLEGSAFTVILADLAVLSSPTP